MAKKEVRGPRPPGAEKHSYLRQLLLSRWVIFLLGNGFLVISQTVSGVLLFYSWSPILIRQAELGDDGSDPRRDAQDSSRGHTNLLRRLWSDEGKILMVGRK